MIQVEDDNLRMIHMTFSYHVRKILVSKSFTAISLLMIATAFCHFVPSSTKPLKLLSIRHYGDSGLLLDKI